VNLDRLGDFVERVAGIVIPPRDLPRIEGRLEARWRALDLPDVDSYLDRLERDPLGEETRRLLSLVTINESSLFRSPRQFEVLKETVLPRIRRSHEGMVSVWSAGCARGEEAVSLAITLAEFFGPGPQPWRVVATDLDQEAMAAARNWRFGPRATRLVPEELAQRYLRPRGDAMEVVGDLRRRITFEDQNLTQLPGVLAEYRFDVVFLRNVLIYFRPDVQRSVVEAVTRLMRPGAYLFVGPSESLWSLGLDLEPVDLGGAFAYRRTRGTVAPEPETTPSPVGEKRPEDPSPSMRRRVVRAVAERRDGEARELLDRADCGRGDPTLQTARGLMAARAGDGREAIRLYRAVVYLDPKLVQVRLLLADQLLNSGRHGRALAEYRTAVSIIERGNGRLLDGWRDLGLHDLREVSRRCRDSLRESRGGSSV
jgi:chemotaxis protein methyltransferase CheR